ncbi:MAG: Ribosomal protein S12 methylthiotransferase RimO [Planctomycetes bacterium ADurb.Bin126]|nr:MAG: Ribosomal protein S12 methylthiotransferase RimO [Planctomycetes bacterium ADurb.Bin126]
MDYIGDIISERLLPRVRQPGQYVGCEINARRKDPAAADVSVLLAFPDTYGIGISHLGSQVLYQLLNDIDGCACDRTYCPQRDAEQVMREQSIPLFGWESRLAARDFDLLGFSLTYEMCVTNVLTMLDLAGVGLKSADRGQDDPIVLGGDAVADSPEILADFIDIFLPGDGEASLPPLIELVRRMKKQGAARDEILLAAAREVAGAYVPRFYQPRYNADGTLAGMDVLAEGVPAVVPHVHLQCLSDSPAIVRPLVPLAEAVHERVVIEIMRGCPNACRFCQAGHARLPVRMRSVDEIVRIAREALAATGFDEVSLLSLSSSDYPRLDELIDRLNAEFAQRRVSVSLPSLRVGSQLQQLPRLTSAVRKGGLTIAAEAGSERLREAIRKDIRESDMIDAVKAAYRSGWRSVKVYFMAGLPGESEQDIDEIFHLCRRLSDARREVDGQRGSISASLSWMVPKPHTPMQWCAMRDAEYFFAVRRRLRELSWKSPVSFKFHRIERSVLESALCRGDRRVGGLDEVLPWSHIACPRTQRFLKDEHRRMTERLV